MECLIYIYIYIYTADLVSEQDVAKMGFNVAKLLHSDQMNQAPLDSLIGEYLLKDEDGDEKT